MEVLGEQFAKRVHVLCVSSIWPFPKCIVYNKLVIDAESWTFWGELLGFWIPTSFLAMKETSSYHQVQFSHTFMLFPLVGNVLHSLKNWSIQQILARQSYIKYPPDFHDKYGNTMLVSKTTFCIVLILVITQIGIEWSLSFFGRVISKE